MKKLLLLFVAVAFFNCNNTNMVNHNVDLNKIKVEVDGELWHPVRNLNNSGPKDRHYILTIDEKGGDLILFGDGKHGARLPSGTKSVKVTYHSVKNYSGVSLQQGRVLLDADWNEQN